MQLGGSQCQNGLGFIRKLQGFEKISCGFGSSFLCTIVGTFSAVFQLEQVADSEYRKDSTIPTDY